MRLLIVPLIVVLAWWIAPARVPAPAQDPGTQDAPPSRGPQLEEIVIPIMGSKVFETRAYFPAAGGDLEVFREIHALAREGIVAGPGQAPPKLKILREFFAPTPQTAGTGLLGHYVFIVECNRGDLKRVVVGSSAK
jgi:hypothetical protein